MRDLRRHPRLPRQAPGLRRRPLRARPARPAALHRRRAPRQDPRPGPEDRRRHREGDRGRDRRASPRPSPEAAATRPPSVTVPRPTARTAVPTTCRRRAPMPSLKDLKIRIASVKSTRKITKAMQMVAAAKLRRAQEARREPRAPTPSAWRPCSATSPPAPRRAPRRRGSSPAPAATRHHLLVVATSERGLCGGFNSSIVRLARAHIHPAPRRGQDGQDPHHRQEGPRAAPPRLRPAPRRPRRPLGACAGSATTTRSAVAHDILHRYDAGEFDVCTIFYNRFQSVISQIPTARQLIPAVFEARPPAASAPSTNTSPTRRRSSPTCCRAASRRRSSPRSWRTPPPSRARG